MFGFLQCPGGETLEQNVMQYMYVYVNKSTAVAPRFMVNIMLLRVAFVKKMVCFNLFHASVGDLETSLHGVLAKSRYCPRTGGPCGTVAAELDAQLKKFAISHIENKHWSICNLRSPGSLRNVPDSHVNSQPATLMAGGSRVCLSFLRNCFNHEKRGQRHRFSKVRIHQSTL